VDQHHSGGYRRELTASHELYSRNTDKTQQLVKITSKEPPEVLAQNKLALRVGVESGGCHGYQYTMEIVEDRGTDD
jgi:Fe-S cluster assembly iron-binding protein IscA